MESTAQSLYENLFILLYVPDLPTFIDYSGSTMPQLHQCTLVVYKLLNRGVFLIVHRTASAFCLIFGKKPNKNSDINNETAPCCTRATNSNNS